MIITIIFPFALKAAVRRQNNLKGNDNGKTPEEMSTGVTSSLDRKIFHNWGFPVYILDAKP